MIDHSKKVSLYSSLLMHNPVYSNIISNNRKIDLETSVRRKIQNVSDKMNIFAYKN